MQVFICDKIFTRLSYLRLNIKQLRSQEKDQTDVSNANTFSYPKILILESCVELKSKLLHAKHCHTFTIFFVMFSLYSHALDTV